MVIQQNKAFRVWGYADPGTAVRVTADWFAGEVVVRANDTREFLALIDVPAIQAGDFKQHWLTVRSERDEIILDSLLIGDVWLCSGQSNMQFSLKEDQHAAADLPQANQEYLRLFSAGLNFSNEPIDSVSGEWKVCDSTTAKDFSAVAYYMGKKLLDSLHYPIGLIFTGIGASAGQAYVPRSVLASDSLLRVTYLQPYLDSPKSKEKIDGGFSFEKVTRPYLLYNALIHPFVNLSITGFTWYQGESNHLERMPYTRLTQAMIKAWRAAFSQGQLPFYYVLIAPYDHEKRDSTLTEDAFFREAQERIATLNNTAMVVSVDIGGSDNLHPTNKKPLGERLALTALNRTYGRLHVAYEGPRLQCVTYQGNRASVHYMPMSLAGGLRTADNRSPAFFYVAGKDRVFHPAVSVIRGNTIELSSKQVKHPVAVRYAFFNYPETNLQNGAGLPALPFRTDSWPE
ncbi:sialate O-acetylesterase [Olivibacter ginsenosidimutans]|uniref:Sialate O-acetylesterase n=2 Tax=Olivibacter ginsenosidimutans TaxID=1176537 RepID=A0ABP9CGU4_9SPHI